MERGRNGWLSGALFCALLGFLTWFAPFGDQVSSRKGRAVAAAFDSVVQPVVDVVGKLPLIAVFAVAALLLAVRGFGLKLPGLSGARPSLPRFRRERPEPEEEAEEPSAPRQRRRDLNRLALTDEGAQPYWHQAAAEPEPVEADPSDDAEAPQEEFATQSELPEPESPYEEPPYDEPPSEDPSSEDPSSEGPSSEEPLPEDPSPYEEPPPAQESAEADLQATWDNPFATDRAHAEYLTACHAFDKPIDRKAVVQSYRNLVGPDAELSDALYEDVVARVLEQQRRTTPHGQRLDPVAIVRKPREKSRDWSGDRSWFGGLPKLGEAAWPRGKDGKPLLFVAQIDLAEVASVNPDTPLPEDGSLAFFIGSAGAVVHVPPGVEETATPPDDLPPAFGEGGYPMPEQHSRVTHRTYPFWPVEPIRLHLPDGLPDLPGPDDDDDAWDAFEQIREAQVEALHAIVPNRRLLPDGETMPGTDKLWWFGADYVLRQLQESYDYVESAVALREKWIADAQGYQVRLAAENPPDEAKISGSKDSEERHRQAIPAIREQGEVLREFIGHFEAFIAGKRPWDEMTGEEITVLEDVLAEARTQFPDLRKGIPSSTREVWTICVRRMITGDDSAVAALPDDLLDYLNTHERLASENQHQMFGVGGSQQGAMYDHLSDHLLLQLGPDDDAELNFPDMGIWQFWLSPEDLEAGRWDKAVLTFECG